MRAALELVKRMAVAVCNRKVARDGGREALAHLGVQREAEVSLHLEARSRLFVSGTALTLFRRSNACRPMMTSSGEGRPLKKTDTTTEDDERKRGSGRESRPTRRRAADDKARGAMTPDGGGIGGRLAIRSVASRGNGRAKEEEANTA